MNVFISITHPEKQTLERPEVIMTASILFVNSFYKYIQNISSEFVSNSEANASELLENSEEIFQQYDMHSVYVAVLI